ncbi:hypothetical protein D3C87_2086500 [compost metagenome]
MMKSARWQDRWKVSATRWPMASGSLRKPKPSAVPPKTCAIARRPSVKPLPVSRRMWWSFSLQALRNFPTATCSIA